MSEQLSTLPEAEVYEQLAVEEATSPEDIIALREMAQSDLAKVSIKPEGGAAFDVTAIGSEKLAELSKVDDQALKDSMAANSQNWVTEEK